MTAIACTLFDFSHKDVLLSVFEEYSDEYVYTTGGVFRRRVPPGCGVCGSSMNHNGYNVYAKKGLGSVRIGRYVCPRCGTGFEEERGFWEQLKQGFFDIVAKLYQVLRIHHVSYEGISDVMGLVFPRGKDTIHEAFNTSVEEAFVPPLEDFRIVHYDEQHPKRGRTQKYRLTLLDGVSGRPIAEGLFDDKSPETVKTFLENSLDTSKPIFIVTDLCPTYPEVFREVFGDNMAHQFCLLHLNKLVVKTFPRKTTLEQEYVKYRLLDIFYNREPELQFLRQTLEEEQDGGAWDKTQHYFWTNDKKKKFNKFLHRQELARRRNKQNLEQRTYLDSWNRLNKLLHEIDKFDKPVQKRLQMISRNWKHLTAFHFVEGAPATNNRLENYYSTSLKTHRKKQFRTDRGIKNQMKLAHIQRAKTHTEEHRTILQAFRKFTPFLEPG